MNLNPTDNIDEINKYEKLYHKEVELKVNKTL